MININTVKLGQKVRFTEGDLVDEGEVFAIDYDADEIIMRSYINGMPSDISVHVDEPGLEIMS